MGCYTGDVWCVLRRSRSLPLPSPIAPHKPPPVELFQTGQPGSDVRAKRILLVSLHPALPGPTGAAGLADTIARLKPGIVAAGICLPLSRHRAVRRTGFVVPDDDATTDAQTVPERPNTGRRAADAIFAIPVSPVRTLLAGVGVKQ